MRSGADRRAPRREATTRPCVAHEGLLTPGFNPTASRLVGHVEGSQPSPRCELPTHICPAAAQGPAKQGSTNIPLSTEGYGTPLGSSLMEAKLPPHRCEEESVPECYRTKFLSSPTCRVPPKRHCVLTENRFTFLQLQEPHLSARRASCSWATESGPDETSEPIICFLLSRNEDCCSDSIDLLSSSKK